MCVWYKMKYTWQINWKVSFNKTTVIWERTSEQMISHVNIGAAAVHWAAVNSMIWSNSAVTRFAQVVAPRLDGRTRWPQQYSLFSDHQLIFNLDNTTFAHLHNSPHPSRTWCLLKTNPLAKYCGLLDELRPGINHVASTVWRKFNASADKITSIIFWDRAS